MKKVITLLTVLLIVLSFASAASWTESMYRSGVVQGAYGSVVKVVFTQIPTQSSSFSVGMPFDIEGRLVQYSATEDGRLISYWSVLSNSKFKLYISAGKLQSESKKDGKPETELDYILKFTYSLGYKDLGGTQKTLSGNFSINTETEECTYVSADGAQKTSAPQQLTMNYSNENNNPKVSDNYYEVDLMPTSTSDESIIGSVDGSVYFMFTSKSSADIAKTENNPVVSGDYTATVKVVIFAEETSSK